MSRTTAVFLVTGLALAGCGGGSTDAALPADGSHVSTTSTTLGVGNLDLRTPDGFIPIPVPDAGFGLAVPEGFQATLLTPDAMKTLESAGVPDTGFVDAAAKAADSGALLYAAGQAADGAVTDVKLDVQYAEDPDAVLLQVSLRVEKARNLDDVQIDSDLEEMSVRIRFTSPGPDGAAGRTQGTQFLYRAPDAVWSLIVTSEESAGHDEVADAIGDSFVLGAP